MSSQVGGGYFEFFFYMLRLAGLFFWVQNLECQYFLGISKNKYFWGMKIL